MRVTKHHGLGNDFLVFLGEVPLFGAAELAQRLCDRRFGIGADGLIFGAASQIADVRFVLFNADGSQAEMSGNGIRCLAQAVVDATPGMVVSNDVITLAIETVDGVRTLDVSAGRHGDEILATVAMGVAVDIAPPETWHLLEVNPDRPVCHVSLGNPHGVVLTDDVTAINLAELGELVPGINLEIVQPGPTPDSVTMRVHERGAGITLACGTGATASAVAARRWGIVTGDEVTVHQPGGSAVVRCNGDQLTLVGPSVRVGCIDVSEVLLGGVELL